MTSKLARAYLFSPVNPLIAILIGGVALLAMGQTTARNAGVPSHAPRQPLSEVRSTHRASTPDLRKTVPTANPLDTDSLIFLPAVTFDPGGYQASSVAVADVNGDGNVDVVVTNCGSCYGPPTLGYAGSVGVLLGNGDGTLQPAVTYDSGGEVPVFIAIADVNKDGKPDLVVVNRNGNNIGVLLGNGDGTFQPAQTYGSGGLMSPRTVAVADVNGDGWPDLIVGIACADNNCDGWVGVLINNGDGTFQPAVTYPSGGQSGGAVAVADVNGDGKPDVLFTTIVSVPKKGGGSSVQGVVSMLLGSGDGTFQPAVTYPTCGTSDPPFSSLLAVADVNSDGKPDIIVESGNGCGSPYGATGVLLGNGDGTFKPTVTYPSGAGGWGSSVAVADVNADGKLDIVSIDKGALSYGSQGVVAVLLGNGDGTFQPAQNYFSGGFEANSVAIADMNGDGKPDLVVANLCADNGIYCTSASVGVLLNNNGAPPTTTSLVSSPNPADINWAVTYTATVTAQSGGAANGTVMFLDDLATIATVAVAGNQAAYTTSYAAKGTHSIIAMYSGDLNRAAGSASTALTELILKPATTRTVLTTSGSPSFVGQPVTFTAAVRPASGAIPDGELVAFYAGTALLASVPLAGGMAAYTSDALPAKTYRIKATYAGDVNFRKSSGAITQVVEKYTTATMLTSAPNPASFHQPITFTATVASNGPSPTGQVKFMDGSTGIGSVGLNNGIATFTKSTLAVGTHSITAEYTGDADNAASTSPVVSQVVQ
jgi:hypothetical protein